MFLSFDVRMCVCISCMECVCVNVCRFEDMIPCDWFTHGWKNNRACTETSLPCIIKGKTGGKNTHT